MWFNNILIYQCELPKDYSFNDALSEHPLKPCPPHSRFIYGWMSAINDDKVFTCQKYHLFTMGKQERILPRGVVNQALEEKVKQIEFNQDRAVKRAEKAQLREEIEFELLPKSFCVTKTLPALIDTQANLLYINTSSANQASQLLSLLRKSVEGIKIEPLLIESDLTSQFTNWVNNPNLLPSQFTLAPNCVLFAPQDEKKKFNCKGYELPADEICQLIEHGLAVSEISLIWKERIQFTLNNEFSLKRSKCIDYLLDERHEISQLEEEAEQLDANLALLGGELRELSQDLQSLFSKQQQKSSQSLEEAMA